MVKKFAEIGAIRVKDFSPSDFGLRIFIRVNR